MTKQRYFTPDFKAQVVLQMLTEQKSAAEASREYGITDSIYKVGNQNLWNALQCCLSKAQPTMIGINSSPSWNA
ncbi:transposase [Chloroflexota bacterium]